jgi:RimJ/RimL family protein N-acetyltransferase
VKVLSTERLHLRWLEHHDSEFILQLLNDRSFIDNIADRKVRTTEEAMGYIDKLRASYLKSGHGFFLVTDHAENKLGICGIIRREELPDPDVGFAFLPAFCGKGFAYESSRAVMEKATTDWKMNRISAIVSPHNTRSRKLVEKLGLSHQKRVRLRPEDNEVDLFLWEKK